MPVGVCESECVSSLMHPPTYVTVPHAFNRPRPFHPSMNLKHSMPGIAP